MAIRFRQKTTRKGRRLLVDFMVKFIGKVFSTRDRVAKISFPGRFISGLNRNDLNESSPDSVSLPMKATFFPVLTLMVLASMLHAQTCREVVRDGSGRIVKTIDRQNNAGGSILATTRDASGRIIGTAATQPSAGGSSQTSYRDGSGRITGSATTQPTAGGSSRTSYRDAGGRAEGSADNRTGSGSGSNTQYRDAAGRLIGSASSNTNSSGSFTGTQRDATGRLTGSSSGSGKCQGTAVTPVPPIGIRRE